jgi:hypothetical protein
MDRETHLDDPRGLCLINKAIKFAMPPSNFRSRSDQRSIRPLESKGWSAGCAALHPHVYFPRSLRFAGELFIGRKVAKAFHKRI